MTGEEARRINEALKKHRKKRAMEFRRNWAMDAIDSYVKVGGDPKELIEENARFPLALRRVEEIWRLRYYDEQGDFPVKRIRFIKWLAKLLAQPNRNLTVANLLGDPEGKLAADALLGGVPEADVESIRQLRKAIEDIDATIRATGGSAALDERKSRLLQELDRLSGKKRSGKKQSGLKRIRSSVEDAYNNISTQKRMFLARLKKMPKLKAHLQSCIRQFKEDFTFCYRPPANTPDWIIENPSA